MNLDNNNNNNNSNDNDNDNDNGNDNDNNSINFFIAQLSMKWSIALCIVLRSPYYWEYTSTPESTPVHLLQGCALKVPYLFD